MENKKIRATRKSHVKSKDGRRFLAVCLAGVLTMGVTACGSTDTVQSEEDAAAYVYVPQYISISEEENTWLTDTYFTEGKLYYRTSGYDEQAGTSTSSYEYLDLKNPQAEPVVVLQQEQIPESMSAEENTATTTLQILPCEDGILMITSTSPLIDADEYDEAVFRRQQEQTTYSMYKVTADGTEVFRTDITQQIKMDENRPYLQYMRQDVNGNIFLSNGESYIWVFDKDGKHVADVPVSGGWITAMGVTGDGRMAVLQDPGRVMNLFVYNEKTKSFSDSYDGLPNNCWNSDIIACENGVLLYSDTALYEYNMETKTYKEILQWLSCDMNPDYIESVSMLEDGSIAAYINDWGTGESSLAILKKTEASQVVQKEVLTIATMNQSQFLQAAVVNFNKNSTTHRIEVIDYSASVDWSSADATEAYEDAMTRFNSDIITGNGADMFCTDEIDMEMFAVKGVIEDLTPYLNTSAVVKKEDLFDSVLDAYTVNDILCCIPTSFSVNTLVGRTAEVGEKSGWTLEEMMGYANEYPEAQILPDANKQAILMYCVLFDFDSWVDWESGECYFNTPAFKQVLAFANSYDADEESAGSGNDLPIQIRNHEVLLYTMDLSEAFSWQITETIFGEPITAIGFPSASTNGVLAYGNNCISINAASKNKDAAWSFIESLLTKEALSDDMFQWGLPISRTIYEEQMKEAMTPNYLLDETGEIVLDEEGCPIEVSNYSYSWGDFEMDIYAVSEDEAAKMMDTINRIDGAYSYNEQLMAIIEEESAPYFAGQKTVDEVADIIQNRIRLYVNESR